MNAVTNVFARICLTTIFLGSAVNKIGDTPGTVEAMTKVGIPAPGLLVYGAILFLLVGGLSVLLGLFARFGAFLLMIFLVMATYYFHAFWKTPDDPSQMIAFLKNVGLFGGLGLVVANGASAGSIDSLRKSRAVMTENEQPNS